MNEFSEHTKLINLVICLSKKNFSKCTPLLYNKGYMLDSIELSFNKEDGRRINVDILLLSPANNKLLFIECKDAGLAVDQAKRYSELTESDIVNAQIVNLTRGFNYQVAYLSTDEKKDKLLEGIRANRFLFPIISSSDTHLKLIANSFNCQVLQELFSNQGLQLDNSYKNMNCFEYPFGRDDSDVWILNCLMVEMIKYSNKEEFRVEELLKDAHPAYPYLSPSGQKELCERVSSLLNTFCSKKEVDAFFPRPENKGKFKVRISNSQSFIRKANKCIATYFNETLPSKRINPFEAVGEDTNAQKTDYVPGRGFV